jgi:hypothetical protein
VSKMLQLDPREVMRACAGLGLVVGIALVARKHQALLLRMDSDEEFHERAVELLVVHCLQMAAADHEPSQADFYRLIDSVVAAAEPPA